MDDRFDEHFHSIRGAIEESRYVYIEQGLNKLSGSCIHIFEVGFGTGLNAYLTLLDSLRSNRIIHYTSIELYPLTKNLIKQLNYPDLLSPLHKKCFNKIHEVDWNMQHRITPCFYFKKISADLASYELDDKYDLIYFDAFSPGKQPELWTYDIFERLFVAMNNQGVLVTYSSSGQVRRSLLSAGFRVEKMKGPGTKRHMIRAIKLP